MAKTTQPLSTFSKFSDLPTEIRLKIWATACCQPRNVGIWAEFQRCEVENTIFYTQLYVPKLTQIITSPILLASKEAQAEAEKHYIVEFQTSQSMRVGSPRKGLMVTHPGFYINYECETLCPRGNWNMISMEDFLIQRAQKQLRFLAMDITSDFYRELYQDYIAQQGWPFEVMEEVILYDATGMAIFKKGYDGEKVELDFVDVKGPSAKLKSAEERLCGVFNKMERKAKADSENRIGGDGWVKRPRITIRELVARPL